MTTNGLDPCPQKPPKRKREKVIQTFLQCKLEIVVEEMLEHCHVCVGHDTGSGVIGCVLAVAARGWGASTG